MVTAGRAVMFSGLTVAVGLLALIVVPVSFLRSVGVARMLIPLVSVAVALTLLPVLLSTIGPRLDWPRIRREDHAGRGWLAWGRLVNRHRWLAAGVGIAVLAGLLIAATGIHFGNPAADNAMAERSRGIRRQDNDHVQQESLAAPTRRGFGCSSVVRDRVAVPAARIRPEGSAIR